MREKLANPIKFQWVGGGPEQHGYDVSILIDICRIIIKAAADGKLGKRQEPVLAQANVILNASAKAGIKDLVYALAGYNPTAQEVIAAFKVYVQEEAKRYEKEFPPELYAQWYKLYEIPVLGSGKPWTFKHLTLNHIYFPLARSNGKITQLLRAAKQGGGKRSDKLFQFLNDVGARALRMQLGRVLEMAESSPDRATYEKKIQERFGDQPELKLVFTAPSTPKTIIEPES